MSNNIAPQHIMSAGEAFVKWYQQTYPYLGMNQQLFDVVADTLASLHVPAESVSLENYVAAFQLAVTQGKIALPPSPHEVAQQEAAAKLLRQAEETEAAKLAELARKERQARLESAQLARTPGANSAFASQEQIQEEKRKVELEKRRIQNSQMSRERHEQFNELVRQARIDASSQIHSRKLGRWSTLYAKIKQRFPEDEFNATY